MINQVTQWLNVSHFYYFLNGNFQEYSQCLLKWNLALFWLKLWVILFLKFDYENQSSTDNSTSSLNLIKKKIISIIHDPWIHINDFSLTNSLCVTWGPGHAGLQLSAHYPFYRTWNLACSFHYYELSFIGCCALFKVHFVQGQNCI